MDAFVSVLDTLFSSKSKGKGTRCASTRKPRVKKILTDIKWNGELVWMEILSFQLWFPLLRKLSLKNTLFWEREGLVFFSTYSCSTRQLLCAYSDILGAILIYKTHFSLIKDLKNLQCLVVNMIFKSRLSIWGVKHT